jgi:Holliday junction resolvase RusA-like endonuclease
MGSVSFDLPLPPKECHQNRSGRTTGWRETARVVREARDFACLTSLMQSTYEMCPRWRRCSVSLLFRFPDRRRRDLFNYAGACKPYLDGLVDAGVMADDSGIEWGEISRCIDREHPGVTIKIEPITEKEV